MFRSNAALIALEACGMALAVLIAVLFPRVRDLLSAAETSLRKLPMTRALAIAIVFFVTLLGRLLLLPISPVPVPVIHDEFSYLLAGDTFAHGRLANPMIPGWEHFESFHILQTPSYASMYPPAQGLFLALGQALTTYAWAGVLLSVCLLSAAVCWMLQAWVSTWWSLLGGLLCTLRYGLASYWIDSYWGGAVAALGGAFLIGALARMKRRPTFLQAAMFSVGTFLLASSRPYEGMILFLCVMGWFLLGVFREQLAVRPLLLRFAIPASCMLLFAGAWTLFYFHQVTGHALLMPYQLDEQQYQISRPFIWQTPRAMPAYHHPVMQAYYVGQAAKGNNGHKDVRTFLREAFFKFLQMLLFYLWPAIILVGIGVCIAWKRDSVRLALAAIAAVWVGLCLEAWPVQFHYSAPILACTMILTVEAAQALNRREWFGRPIGKCIVWVSLLLTLATLTARLTADAIHIPVTPYGWVPWATTAVGDPARQSLIDRLNQTPGKHLVIVHYAPDHSLANEWVYNPADIEATKVIFARAMNPEKDQELRTLFPDRNVWEVDADSRPPRLTQRLLP